MKRPRSKVSRKTSSSSSSAAQIFASIDDLLIEIFLRLPMKQLNRCKLVSKHWNSIISDPKLPLFLRKPEPAVGLIFQYHYVVRFDMGSHLESKIVYFNQPAIPKPMFGLLGAKVLHSCNGLLLCKSVSGYQRHYIYNPMTKKSSTLDPGTGEKYFTASIWGMYLAFDPSESCHYKIVCVVRLQDNLCDRVSDDRFKFEVYSSETASWRRCGEPFSAASVYFREGVYWKGAIHWLSLKKSGESIYFNPCCDENDQMLPTVMPSPPLLEDLYKERNHFGESFGHLHLIVASTQINVYELKSDYSEWFVKYKVDLPNVFDMGLFSICTLVRGNKDDDSFLVLRLGGKKFMRCNLVDKTCETILECERKEKHEQFPHQYIEGAFGNVDGVWATETETRINLGYLKKN